MQVAGWVKELERRVAKAIGRDSITGITSLAISEDRKLGKAWGLEVHGVYEIAVPNSPTETRTVSFTVCGNFDQDEE